MKSAFKILKRGGRGVQVALHSHTDPGPDTVYWSPQRWRDENGRLEPAGGFNSFCLVENPDGRWVARSGERVSLLSINGIGEIRWSVEPGSEHYGEGAVEHFGLKKWEPQR
jgi:hypothetical protein